MNHLDLLSPPHEKIFEIGVFLLTSCPTYFTWHIIGVQILSACKHSFFCCCSHCLYSPGLELHLWQLDWEPHLWGIRGDFLSANALLPGLISRLSCSGPGATAHRWEETRDRKGRVGYGGGAGMGKAWGVRKVGNWDWERGFGIRKKGRQDMFSYPWTIANSCSIILWCGVMSCTFLLYKKKSLLGEFPGGPTVRTLCFHCWRFGFNPRSGN